MAESIVEETDGGGSSRMQGSVFLIREFEVSDPPRPTGYFRIDFCFEGTKGDTVKERQRGNPHDLKMVRKYQQANALNTSEAAKDAMKTRKVDGKEE